MNVATTNAMVFYQDLSLSIEMDFISQNMTYSQVVMYSTVVYCLSLIYRFYSKVCVSVIKISLKF